LPEEVISKMNDENAAKYYNDYSRYKQALSDYADYINWITNFIQNPLRISGNLNVTTKDE
jgi:hypothetical protein